MSKRAYRKRMAEIIKSDAIIIESRDGKLEGIATGHYRKCTMEGCTGMRWRVEWPDGSITYPCSHGMESVTEQRLRIL